MNLGNWLNAQVIGAVARWILTGVFGALAAKGIIDGNTEATLIGAGVSLITGIWSSISASSHAVTKQAVTNSGQVVTKTSSGTPTLSAAPPGSLVGKL